MNELKVIEETPAISQDLVKLIAMDIGKEICVYIEVMFPDVAKAGEKSTFLLSVRNSIYNEIMESLKTTNERDILARIDRRKKFRRKWKADYKKLRETPKR